MIDRAEDSHALSVELRRELLQSQELGLIGPRPLDEHVQHALGYQHAVDEAPRRAVDLGPGGGLPALVLAEVWPECRWTLIDARERAIARLEVMIARLGWTDRVTAVCSPAEVAGHEADLRGVFDVVTARGFGPPSMTAECGAAFLRLGGQLVVSEPPDQSDRWPQANLEELGLRRVATKDARYVVLESMAPYPDGFPRRATLPRRRPLW